MLRWLTPVAFVLLASASGCGGSAPAQLRVVGVQQSAAKQTVVLHVQVVNRAHKPMRLERLVYTFAGAQHQLQLDQRQIEPGAAIVLSVPVDAAAAQEGNAKLQGRLYAEVDQIEQSFKVSAAIEPEQTAAAPRAPEEPAKTEDEDSDEDPQDKVWVDGNGEPEPAPSDE